MGEDVARAVAARGPLVVTIGGRECRPRPLGIRDLTEVERDCLSRYKRQVLETYASNLDLLPADRQSARLESKMEEISKWDIGNLPPKYAYDASTVVVTPALKQWVADNYSSTERELTEKQCQCMVALALDQCVITEDEYQRLANSPRPRKSKVPYVNWWITGCYEGIISLVWHCFSNQGVTKDQVIDEVGSNLSKMMSVATEIERLSAPSVGNG